MKNKNTAFLFILLFVFTACEEEMPFNIHDNPPKLTINAIMDGNNAENYIFLSLTGRDHFNWITTDAVISVYVNNQLREQIKESENEGGYLSKLKFDPGDKVKIEANTTDGKYHAWAEDVIPKLIRIDRIDTMSYPGYPDYLRMSITFTDNSNEKNYYRLVFFTRDTLYGASMETGNDTIAITERVRYLITHEDIVLNEGRTPINDNSTITGGIENRLAIFDDSRLNGAYTMVVSCNLNYYPSPYVCNWKA